MPYLQAISQISIQKPLCEEWLTCPIMPAGTYNPSLEPDYSAYFQPMAARRMGRLLKRAVATALDVTRRAAVPDVDAVVIGTGLGCLDNTEKFLNDLLDNDEETLSPTPFMQSTQNTIAAQIALALHCHGYNSTYSQRGLSFENALFDVFLQMKLQKISTALVGAHDEMTPTYFKLFHQAGWWQEDAICGDCSLNMVLTAERNENSLCQLQDMRLMSQRTPEELKNELMRLCENNNMTINDLDAIVCGISGDKNNDLPYLDFIKACGFSCPVIPYKHLFGEGFSNSAFGTYVGTQLLHLQEIPQHLSAHHTPQNPLQHILIYHHFQNQEHAFIILSKC